MSRIFRLIEFLVGFLLVCGLGLGIGICLGGLAVWLL